VIDMPRTPLWISLALIAASLAVSAWLYPSLPDVVPTHWNIRGEADGFGPKGVAAWLLPAMALGVLGFMALVPWMSPKDYQIDTHGPAYGFIVVATTALLVFIHLLSLAGAMRADFPVGRTLMAGVLLFLAAIGSVLGNVKRNFYIGVRVPWTLASERVWDDTHRVAAKVFVIGGMIGAALALIDQTVAAMIMLVPIVLVPIVYSFVRYKQLERLGQL